MNTNEILLELKKHSDPKNVIGMARYGIIVENALGVCVPVLRRIAKETGKNHKTAFELWKTGIHDARILASMIDEPLKVTEEQADEWAGEFNSWDLCDQCCLNLFRKTDFAHKKVNQWTKQKQEFVKRAGFALLATLAVHDKNSPDRIFIDYLNIIERESTDDRNFVKKAVNWALRQIGKKNLKLHSKAIQTAKRIAEFDSKAAKWIARDAIRELESEKTFARIKERKS